MSCPIGVLESRQRVRGAAPRGQAAELVEGTATWHLCGVERGRPLDEEGIEVVAWGSGGVTSLDELLLRGAEPTRLGQASASSHPLACR